MLAIALAASTGMACTSGYKAQAEKCFRLLSAGNIDGALGCLPPEARTNDQARQTVTEQATQFAGCAGQVAQYQEYNTNTQTPSVVITFKPVGCGIPPNAAQKVTAVELQMVRQGSDLWVLNYRRIAEAAGQPSNIAPR